KTYFKDKEGNIIPGFDPEEGTVDKKEVPEYRFVETRKLPNGDTEHVYEKVIKRTTVWRDENGNPLKSSENGVKDSGTIPGYEFVRTVVDANGNIHHIFRKVKLAEPKMQVKRLANTGSKTTNVTTGFGILLVGIAAVIRKRKKED
ncbi:LPXTG cell wall anchor domain-containing protein, partial [Gemella morbillorum]